MLEALQICADALLDETATKKVNYSALLMCEIPRKDIEAKLLLTFTVFGEAFKEHYEFDKMFWRLSEQLLAEGKFKPHRLDVRGESLESMLHGMEELRQGKVSGKKLVYKSVYVLCTSK